MCRCNGGDRSSADRLIATVAKYQLDCEIKSEALFSFERSTEKSS